MSDITERLRSALCQTYECDRIGYEAADEIDRLRAELAEARRLLDEARKQEPVGFVDSLVGSVFVTGDECDLYKTELMTPVYAAPVPAQPAVPDDAGGVKLCVECGGQGQYWIGEPSDPVAAQCDACGGTGMVSMWVIISQMESVGAGGASHRYVTGWARDLRAILSSTEGRSNE